MTIELRIPITDDAVLAYWMARAEKHGISIEEEIAALIKRPVGRIAFENKLAKLRESIQIEHGILPDSTPLIREDRDAS